MKATSYIEATDWGRAGNEFNKILDQLIDEYGDLVLEHCLHPVTIHSAVAKVQSQIDIYNGGASCVIHRMINRGMLRRDALVMEKGCLHRTVVINK